MHQNSKKNIYTNIHVFFVLEYIAYSSSSDSDQSAQSTGLGLKTLAGAPGHSASTAFSFLGVRGDSSSELSSSSAKRFAVLLKPLTTGFSEGFSMRLTHTFMTASETCIDAVQYLAKCPLRPHLLHSRAVLVGQQDFPLRPITLWDVTMVSG